MHEGVRTGSVIHSARTVGGGAGLSVTVDSRSRGTHSFAAEPTGERATGQYPDRRTRFLADGSDVKLAKSASKVRIACTLYGRRIMHYGLNA